jgi:O-antigen/teichoic acid export membrane protein
MVLGAVPIAYVPMLIYDDALRATNRMGLLFRSYAISAVIALTVGIALVWSLGLLGATLAVLVAAVASGAAMAYHYRQRAT